MRDLLDVLREIDKDPELMERAARKVCHWRGIDANEYVRYDHPQGYAVNMKRPRWASVREELQEAATTILCLVDED